VVPTLQKLLTDAPADVPKSRVLVLAPTRELAVQIEGRDPRAWRITRP
jgi:superfamily II DNA/RNA helicase